MIVLYLFQHHTNISVLYCSHSRIICKDANISMSLCRPECNAAITHVWVVSTVSPTTLYAESNDFMSPPRNAQRHERIILVYYALVEFCRGLKFWKQPRPQLNPTCTAEFKIQSWPKTWRYIFLMAPTRPELLCFVEPCPVEELYSYSYFHSFG